ncbi:hypothetical protein [Falsiroseomonas oryziterrae]|uniref:hypothetical protein n=1 Tax=Falsiroseomonas oryziterrae TaxID=2911368 RepID=UPI001F1B7786|nr:hypothetical protein [Roseomonas sp. NPKOSM-4]
MGGLFRAPKPVVIEAPPPAAQAQSVAQIAAQSDAAAEEGGRDARLRAIARARRGLPGTIATGERGVLDPLPAFVTRKTLLGE